MIGYAFIPLGISIIVALLLIIIIKKNQIINYRLLIKIFGFSLLAVCFIKCFMSDGFISVINGGKLWPSHPDYFQKIDPFETIVRWLVFFAEVVILTLLKNNNKSNRFLSVFVALPCLLLGLFDMPFNVDKYFLPGAYAAQEGLIFPVPLIWVLFILEYSLALLIPILLIFENKKDILLTEKKDKVSTIKLAIIGVLVCIPFMTYASIFGTTDIKMTPFSVQHIGWIIAILVVALIIFFTFKNENKDIKWTIMSLLIIALFFHFNNSFKIGYKTDRIPLHLCSLAAELFIVILFTESKSLYNFIFVANPIGALMAIFVLSEQQYMFNFFMIHYLVEHLYVLIIPIFLLAFGLFEKPKFKFVVRDFFIYFTVYFFVCLFANTINNGIIVPTYPSIYNVRVNYFFQLECPLKGIGFIDALNQWKVSMFGQDIYILYLIVLYLAFSALSLAFYWVQIGIGNLVVTIKQKVTKVA